MRYMLSAHVLVHLSSLATVVSDGVCTHVDPFGTGFNLLLWNLSGFATENKYLSRTFGFPPRPFFPRILFGRILSQMAGASHCSGFGESLSLEKAGLRVNARVSVAHSLNVTCHPTPSSEYRDGYLLGNPLLGGGRVLNFVALNYFHLLLTQY